MKKFVGKEYNGTLEIGIGATGSYWTDCYPFEIVKVISDKTIEVRRLDSKMKEGHDLLDQEYDLFSNEENPIKRVRKCKRGWKSSDGMKFRIGHAREYYDPCF